MSFLSTALLRGLSAWGAIDTDPILRTKVSSLVAELAVVRRRENMCLIQSQVHTARKNY